MAATPNLDRRLIDLAFKLRDPVENATADGKIFSFEARAKYLTRAYGSLKRKLKSIMKYHETNDLPLYNSKKIKNT